MLKIRLFNSEQHLFGIESKIGGSAMLKGLRESNKPDT
ncbi:hypothetical protein FHS68_003868 [Dyadobacter arcticus]|uniref:Uncharacterized protein n=1 Tax=Dyadobacter arcticus TaxID=1078754 RepID=A0ABX0UNZ9_9BACT|nr:hypothetical protein [Dyadobacter arcticus]